MAYIERTSAEQAERDAKVKAEVESYREYLVGRYGKPYEEG
jgi:hypothetical protein